MNDNYASKYLKNDKLIKMKKNCKSKDYIAISKKRDNLNKYYRKKNERRMKKQLFIISLNVDNINKRKRKSNDLNDESTISKKSITYKRNRQKHHENWKSQFIFIFTEFQFFDLNNSISIHFKENLKLKSNFVIRLKNKIYFLNETNEKKKIKFIWNKIIETIDDMLNKMKQSNISWKIQITIENLKLLHEIVFLLFFSLMNEIENLIYSSQQFDHKIKIYKILIKNIDQRNFILQRAIESWIAQNLFAESNTIKQIMKDLISLIEFTILLKNH